MKIITFQILILLLFIQTVWAQSDTIYIDSPGIVGGTWTPDNRYIARWNIFVPYDSVLTIQPGVKIEVQDGFSFKVEGQLNAIGNTNNLIEIKPFNESWKGISFGTPSGEADVNTSFLSFVNIDCGGYSSNNEAVVLGKHIINSINNLRISNAATAIRITGFASIDNIIDCEFDDIIQGIVFQYCDIVSNVQIEGCIFNNILDRAVEISQSQAFLENIIISGCDFDNSALGNNNSESAVYITLNTRLTSVTLNNNNFNAFSLQENSPACIYIFDNEILDVISLNQNDITLCGGETATSPNADFGGFYINQSSKVFLEGNDFSANTGKKSGAGYLKAGLIYCSDNTFLNNRNNYSGNENFAGATTITAGNRIEFDGDTFINNVSAKSGGAMYIESQSNSNPIDLHFTGITLESNGASNEGGAILINATLDSISIANSIISGNSSSAGSGGCFSIICSAFNDLTIGSNTIRDNFVSENSEGGFLFLRHDPSLVPSYGSISLFDNINTVTGHNSTSNYNLIYSKIKSFPRSISISGDNVSDVYPVNGYLYHFELLQSGPEASGEEVLLTMSDNGFQNNQCPVMFFANDSCTITADLRGNTVEGNEESYGTFLTIKSKEAPSLNFEGEQYTNLISGTSGGAVSVNAFHEIGDVNILDVVSQNCFSVEGNGGHFFLESGSSDPSAPQALSIVSSDFSNQDIDAVTGENGGAIFYYTPGNLDSVLIQDCNFYKLRTEVSGGAIYIESSAIADVSILGSEFEEIYSSDEEGAVSLTAFNGNINTISLLPDEDVGISFSSCSGMTDGGALSVKASKEIGTVVIDGLLSSDCSSGEGNGGHISLVSLGSDPSITQNLVISNSIFDNMNVGPAGNDGGAIYYSTPGSIDSLVLKSNEFSDFDIFGDGGAFFLDAKEIDLINIHGSVFSGLTSLEAGGGAIYISAGNGNIRQIDNTGSGFLGCSSKLDGGALYIRASGEIGSIIVDSVESKKCYSSEGDGGHFAFISGSSNQSLSQSLAIYRSAFDNTGITNVTGGNGGAVYYSTPDDLGSINITSSLFSGLKAGEKAGAFCINTKETGEVNILGSTFSQSTSLDTAGAVYLNAANGNIGKLRIAPLDNIPSKFTSCSSRYDGGAFCAISSSEIGMATLDSVEINKCFSNEGNGGHCSLISLGADPSLVQQLTITGSEFSNEGISNITGENGGILYYSAFSDLASVIVTGSAFKNPHAVKDGGSLFIKAAKIDSFGINTSLFSSSVSEVLSGGAVYVKTSNGLINGNFGSNRFINCNAGQMGGSVFIEDNKLDNVTENISWSANTYRQINQEAGPEVGGAVYCKGISSVTFVSDSSISQSSASQGGFVYLEKVYRSKFDGVYTYGNSSESGGVIYHNGDEGSSFSQSARIINSTFLFNNAGLTGGCFFISHIDTVEIGKEGGENTFVANQSLSSVSNDQVGGGVFFIQDARFLDVNYNSFYVNQSQNSGGIGIVSNVSTSLLIEGNSFLSNQAKAGGAFTFINSFASGTIAGNRFSYNSSTEQAGALLFSPSATNNFLVRDNTFFMNNTGKLGGAIASYRPIRLIRNLFRENNLVDINPNVDHKGTTVYLSGNGNQAVIKNCVFDQNYYEEDPGVASIYFDALQSAFPEFNIANCSFFNFSDEHLSVYNDDDQDTVYIENSIFTQRQNISRAAPVIYFNETVRSRYSDLIYSQIDDSVNHNVDEYVYFNIGDYYFDSTQYPVDQGNPDPSFNDFHMPPGYGTPRNDQGVSGGPDNPDTNGVFLFEEPVNLPTNFDVVVVSHNCFTYSFECRGEFVDTYEYFYWFMPDTIIVTNVPELTYTFSPALHGNYSVTALGHDVGIADVYGFGQKVINLDFILINSLATGYNNNLVPVPSVPFTFTIEAGISYDDDTPYSWEWTVLSSQGVEYTMAGYESVNVIEIQKITAVPASMMIRYSLEACGRVLDSTITVTFQAADQWGYPTLSFYPVSGDIPDTISFFIMEFDRIMTKSNGDLLENVDVAAYVTITSPPCPGLIFRLSVEYTSSKTIFKIEQVNEITQQADTLCNGEYKFDVKCSELYTQFYRLSIDDGSKSYSVCCNDIDDNAGRLRANIYPNPFSDNIHISFNTRDNYFIEIVDLSGHVQVTGKYAGVNEVTLNLEALSDGFYILRAVNSRNTEHFYMKINKITH